MLVSRSYSKTQNNNICGCDALKKGHQCLWNVPSTKVFRIFCYIVNEAPTWFFPFSINRLVTLPKGIPNEMTSASDTSMGTLRTWRTREGAQGDRSPLYGLLSLPLAAKK